MDKPRVAVFTLLGLAATVPAQQNDWFQSPVSGRWYAVTYDRMTWLQAEGLAVSMGGHLATIRSQAEQAWIASTFPFYLQPPVYWNNLHIGLNDIAIEGSWEWSSGEPVIYTAWEPGSPDPTYAAANDIAFMRGLSMPPAWGWKDYDGLIPMRGLLELPAPPTQCWSWPRLYGLGLHPNHGCSFDVDGDEDIDHVAPASYMNLASVLFNDGSGAISGGQSFSSAATSFTAAAVDWNGDGRRDVVVASNYGLFRSPPRAGRRRLAVLDPVDCVARRRVVPRAGDDHRPGGPESAEHVSRRREQCVDRGHRALTSSPPATRVEQQAERDQRERDHEP
ncbi:MAG: lectin-like protein [Planctomycetota bacterium]